MRQPTSTGWAATSCYKDNGDLLLGLRGGWGIAFDLRGSARPRPSTKPCISPQSPYTWAKEDQDRLDKAQVWSQSLKMGEALKQ